MCKTSAQTYKQLNGKWFEGNNKWRVLMAKNKYDKNKQNDNFRLQTLWYKLQTQRMPSPLRKSKIVNRKRVNKLEEPSNLED